MNNDIVNAIEDIYNDFDSSEITKKEIYVVAKKIIDKKKFDNITEFIESLKSELIDYISDKVDDNFDVSAEFDDSLKVSTDSVKSYLVCISKYSILSEEEVKNLVNKIRLGDKDAFNTLVNHNLKLVVAIAKRYIGNGLDLMDLIQEGNLGLLKAVTRYDLEHDCKFSTYGYYWIKQAIKRAIADKGNPVRIPVHSHELLVKYRNQKNALSSEIGREPSVYELSERLGISLDEVIRIQKLDYVYNVSSLDTPVGEENDSVILDFVESSEPTPEEICINNDLHNSVLEMFHKCNLTEKEILILKYRNGFYNDTCYTLEEVGSIFNVTRERIRQIEAKALKKLRVNRKNYDLRMYL